MRNRPGGRLQLQPGCNRVDGATALIWLRERIQEELVDGEWQAATDIGDLGRTQRHQEFMLEMLRRLRSFTSVTEVNALVEDLSDAFILDESLSLGRAISLIWEIRGLPPNQIGRLVFPGTPSATPEGDFTLIPDQTFTELLLAEYPELAVAA